MEEALKHIRLLHYVLIGAAIAGIVLAFAKHADVSERYDAAVEEVGIVRGLVGLDWKEGGDTARNLFPPLILPTIDKVREDIKRRAALFLSSRLTDALRQKMPNAYPKDVEIKWVTPFIYRSDLPITATFKDILDHFDSIPILAVFPDIDDMRAKNKILADLPPQTTRVEINITAGVDFDQHVDQFGWASAPQSLTAAVAVRVFPRSAAAPIEEKSDIVAHVTRLPQFSQLNTLLRSYRFLHEVLPKIQDLTPDQAIFFLEEKALTTPISTSFLGISVPQSMVPVTAGAIIGLLVIFSTSLDRINLLLLLSKPDYTKDYTKIVWEFSWICLFLDWWSRGFAILTINVLPMAAIGFLGLGSLDSLTAHTSLFGLLVWYAAIGVALYLSINALGTLDGIRTYGPQPADTNLHDYSKAMVALRDVPTLFRVRVRVLTRLILTLFNKMHNFWSRQRRAEHAATSHESSKWHT